MQGAYIPIVSDSVLEILRCLTIISDMQIETSPFYKSFLSIPQNPKNFGQKRQSRRQSLYCELSFINVFTRGLVNLVVMMSTIFKKIRTFLSDEDGPAAVEYAVMLMLILLAVITGVQALGRATGESFEDSNEKLNGAW